MLDHPADPYFPRAGGVLAWYARENPIPWMSRALERGMEIGQTHFALARVLASLGAKEQALLELRLAATYAVGLGTPAAKVVLSLTHDYDEILQAAPEGALGARLLATVALSVRRTEEPELRLRCLSGAVERYPEGVLARAALAEDLSAAIAANSPLICGGDRAAACEQLVLEQVAAIEKLEPNTSTALLTKAQFWMYAGRAADAEMLLRHGCQRFTSQAFSQCQRKRVLAAALTRSRDLLDVASRDLAGAGCTNGTTCGEVYAFLASQAESLGDSSRALTYYKRAVAEDPNDVRWRAVARNALIIGDNAIATNALAQLNRRNPDDADVRRRLEDQRRRAFLNGAPASQ
jgi:tetratricopeptide (TPR) repeat protein